MFYAAGSTRAAHGARAPRPRCCRRGGGVLARDAVDDSGRRTRLSERSSRTLGAPHLAGVAGEHRVARAIGSRSRLQHAARPGARARRRVLQQQRRAARRRSSCTSRPASIRSQPSSRSAHAAGLRVHAWVNVNLVSSAVDLPIARDHLVNRHPEWLMVPREIAQDVAKVAVDSPAYVGKLARWTRAQTGELEGLYASPIAPAAADYLQTVVAGPDAALRGRRRPFRLRSISERQVRLQPARSRRVPQRGAAAPRSRAAAAARREREGRPLCVRRCVAGRLACVPRCPDDGARCAVFERR